MNPLMMALNGLGQQIWLDTLSRPLLQDGTLAHYIEACGVSGVTTNPSIFHQAISQSPAYREAHAALMAQEMTPEARYEALALEDVANACALLAPLYTRTQGQAGYVSLEVSPFLAHDTEATLQAARRLWSAVGHPNLLIKVPATPAGVEAVPTLIEEGIKLNLTLLFSTGQALAVARAYCEGVKRRQAHGKPLKDSHLVASVFVSRVDTLVDARLAELTADLPQGQAAVAMAKDSYRQFRALFAQPDFAPLRAAGAQEALLLWASTGTKNPAYSDLLYVEPLMGPHTVNTLPEPTFKALMDHGRIGNTLTLKQDEAQAHLAALATLGIDLETEAQSLQAAGLLQFEKAYEALLCLMGQTHRIPHNSLVMM
jgi:transaldolase